MLSGDKYLVGFCLWWTQNILLYDLQSLGNWWEGWSSKEVIEPLSFQQNWIEIWCHYNDCAFRSISSESWMIMAIIPWTHDLMYILRYYLMLMYKSIIRIMHNWLHMCMCVYMYGHVCLHTRFKTWTIVLKIHFYDDKYNTELYKIQTLQKYLR